MMPRCQSRCKALIILSCLHASPSPANSLMSSHNPRAALPGLWGNGMGGGGRWGLPLFSFKGGPEKLSDLSQGLLVKTIKCPTFSQVEANRGSD